MASGAEADKVAQFCALTQASEDQARFFLESHNWQLEYALSSFYDGGQAGAAAGAVEGAHGGPSQQPAAPPPMQSASGQPKPKSKDSSSGRRIATLGDYRESEDKDDKQRNQYYAGGSERSGQMIEGAPDDKPEKEDVIESIFKTARQNAEELAKGGQETEKARGGRTFRGAGMRLGEDLEEPAHVESAGDSGDEGQVTKRALTFWREGFTVDDGPLRRYDDPANKQFLDDVSKGIAPAELSVGARGEVHIQVSDRKEEDYVPPPKTFKAFTGSGRQLGSPTPQIKPASAATAPAPASSMTLDPSQPHTSIQIRLADGTRLVAKVNHTHTVGDIRSFVRNSRPGQSDFALMTGFPSKELTDDHATVSEAGLLNAVVLQKPR